MAEQGLNRSPDAGNEKPAPAITILIVNRNSTSYLNLCLRSIRETVGDLSAELVLVDGSSTDNSVALAKGLWPSATVIVVPEKLGYVRGNNVGLKQATGRYTMFLNSDTVVYPAAFQHLIQFMDDHPEVGAASGTILNSDGSDQGVIRHFPTIMNGIFGRRSWLSKLFPNNRWYRQYMQSRQEQSMEPFQTEILSACSMVVRTELVRKLGGLDERFHFYWVDAELCCRLARNGFKIFCVPRARIMHHEGKGGSTSTFAKRLQMNIAFNHDAYLAYVEYHRFSQWDPRRLFARLILTARMILLIVAQFLRPSKATSSGGAN
jgi:N-acetylglucosaminyl-diphospho-decaprenol L-rhamnosyltransferase